MGLALLDLIILNRILVSICANTTVHNNHQKVKSWRRCSIALYAGHGCIYCVDKSTQLNMMTSSNGNIFRVTGPLCGEFTGPGEFPTQRPVTRSFDVFFDLRLNKRLSKQPWGWWFETPSWSLWRHCNEYAAKYIGMINILKIEDMHVICLFLNIIVIWITICLVIAVYTLYFRTKSWNSGMRCMSCHVFPVDSQGVVISLKIRWQLWIYPW